MNFQHATKYLINIFENNDFTPNVIIKNYHSSKALVQACDNGSKITISFPGYKSKITKWGTTYDYRVDLTKDGITTALSHANIITDIYNKIHNCGMSGETLKMVLIEISKEGAIDLSNIMAALQYEPVSPPQELISRIQEAHGTKAYNDTGNSFDLTIEELLASIKWIVLQEDINYPIAKNFEGRKMPFSRYLETIFITHNDSHGLGEVIGRALSHTRPTQWQEMDYSFRDLIT